MLVTFDPSDAKDCERVAWLLKPPATPAKKEKAAAVPAPAPMPQAAVAAPPAIPMPIATVAPLPPSPVAPQVPAAAPIAQPPAQSITLPELTKAIGAWVNVYKVAAAKERWAQFVTMKQSQGVVNLDPAFAMDKIPAEHYADVMEYFKLV